MWFLWAYFFIIIEKLWKLLIYVLANYCNEVIETLKWDGTNSLQIFFVGWGFFVFWKDFFLYLPNIGIASTVAVFHLERLSINHSSFQNSHYKYFFGLQSPQDRPLLQWFF